MPTGMPYGDIYAVNTPQTDRAVAMLQQQEAMQEAKRQQQMASNDEEYRKLYGDLRNKADVEKFTEKYGAYRQAAKDFQRGKFKSNEEFMAAQLKKQNAYADAIGFARQSKDAKEKIKSMYDAYSKGKPWDYNDNAGDLFARANGLSSDQLESADVMQGDQPSKVNLLDINNYRSKVPSDFNLAQVDKDARGTEVPYKGELRSISPIEKEQQYYLYGNTPQKNFETRLSHYSTPKGQAAARFVYSQINPEEMAATQEAIKNVPPEQWKKIGLDKPQDLTIKEDDPIPVRVAKFQAQKDWLSTAPREGETKRYVDKYANDLLNDRQQRDRDAANHAFQAEQQRRSQNFQEKLHSLPTFKDLKTNKEDTQGAYTVLSTISNSLKNGKMSASSTGLGVKGSDSYAIDDPTILEQFKDLAPLSASGKGNYSKPIDLQYDPKANKMELVYTNEKNEKTVKQINPIEYIKAKVKQSYPNKEIGDMNTILTKLYDKNGGNLEKTIQDFEGMNAAPAKPAEKGASRPPLSTFIKK